MTTVTVLLVAVVAIAAITKFSNKNNRGFFGSSTSMFFGDNNMSAGAAC